MRVRVVHKGFLYQSSWRNELLSGNVVTIESM